MDAPECLHRGQLWQFSAQYGGWLAIKLLLFNHALVVDPDVAAASPRRKRRSSLKLWMDLCLVGDIQEAQKEDGAFRRGSYTFLRFASSGSEESEGEEENRPAGAPLSWSEENALRSAQLLSQRSRPTAVQVSGSPVKFEE
ncbi:hypothetical protein BBJ29_002724 [Phytophthora kernoviae]|uniref:Uncharacterized protein n=1 Tax=Phytophthora kernoviae TaxID=325452 RepID=A0A3F2RSG2_9STRA|nr:hypothetical protein BBP00_00004214 [Phytophthora kernoviae]RLN71739.1 hypothetical protein BBJ29_002724 [Phytophthora kernoviae]